VIAKNVQSDDFVTITPGEFEVLKKKYEACEDGGTFKFKGKGVLKEYAKYLIQYIESKFNG